MEYMKKFFSSLFLPSLGLSVGLRFVRRSSQYCFRHFFLSPFFPPYSIFLSFSFFSLFIFSLVFFSPLSAQMDTLQRTDEQTARVQILPAPVNTPYSEYNPSILPDQSVLFFESDRPGGQGLNGDFDIWFSRLQNKNNGFSLPPSFSVPQSVPAPVNSAAFEGQPFIRKTADGWELFFTAFASAERPGPQQTNIYVTRFSQGRWSKPQAIFEINTDFNERMATLSADGNLLIFSSDRPGGFGQDDIWFSRYDQENKRWGKAQNAGAAINSSDSEISPSLHTDGVTLYFSSNRIEGVGGYDLYVTQFEQAPDGSLQFRKAQNFGTPYNSPWDDEHPSVSGDGEYIYFSSNRENGFGLFDIYRAVVPEFARPEVLLTLNAKVVEKGTTKGIEANIELSGQEGNRKISSGLPNGNFSFQLKNRYLYKILITAPGFKPLEQIIDLRKIHTKQALEKTYELERIVRLPENFRIYIHFENQKGERLVPKTYYLASPSMSKPKEFTADHFFQIEGKSEKKTNEQVKDYIRKYNLRIYAKLDGYMDAEKFISLYDVIFKQSKYPKSENHVIITMRPGTALSVDELPDTAKAVSVFYFPTAVSDSVTQSKGKNLQELVTYLKENPQLRIYVDGHTDTRGTKQLNTSLSQRRAQFIFEQLRKNGIDENRMFIRWFDYSQPAVQEKNKNKGESLNRRAEIHIVE